MADPRRHESGFALILAILALMLLTFLGLTLATTTSTELQIASNYRNSQQAFYNAEAGLEVGKRVLRGLQSWGLVLPTARAANFSAPSPHWARVGFSGEPSRNYENCPAPPGNCCDNYGYEGYGAVLDPLNTAFPFQNVYEYQNLRLKGTFTLWVRREKMYTGGLLADNPADDQLILTAEGTAPYTAAGTAYTQRNRAVRVLQADLVLVNPACPPPEGNTGNDSTNTNAAICPPPR